MSNLNPKKSPKVCPDILRWNPPRWDLFLGNKEIIKHFKSLLTEIKEKINVGRWRNINLPNTILFGPSRSGKTALTKFFIRCVSCQKLNADTLDPCDGSCSTCQQKPESFGLEGLFSIMAFEDRKIPIQTRVFDCTMIQAPAELQEKIFELANFNGISILYFDEVHRLVKRNMDEMLLKSVEDLSNLWIFSTTNPGELDVMFMNRLLKLKTEFPTREELASWLLYRCNEWGIKNEANAIMRVVDKSNLIVGTALHALALASLDPEKGLNLDLVENRWISKLD